MFTFFRKGMPVLVLWASCLSAFCADIAIIESQSANAIQNMDIKWQAVATSLGHNPSVLPQSALDDINTLQPYALIIVSSAMIDIPVNREAVLRQFIESGRPVYIQAEYLPGLPGNVAFRNIVQSLGGTFNWTGSANGGLVPMGISGSIAVSLNNIPNLNYFWYGAYGSGDDNTHPYMHFNGQDFGFVWCSPDPGDGLLVTNSDQDWVRLNASPGLMANIITVLLNDQPSVQPILTVIDEAGTICEGEVFTFTADIANFSGNCIIQWQANGEDLIGVTGNTISTYNLSEGVAISFSIVIPGICGPLLYYSDIVFTDHFDEPEVPELQVNADIQAICAGEVVQFEANPGSTQGLDNLTYQWYIDELPQQGANQAGFSSAFVQSSIVRCEISFDTNCTQGMVVSSENVDITLDPLISPVLTISADNAVICPGETVNFSAEGDHLGDSPFYEWYVDGTPVGINTPIFSSGTLEEGQMVQCYAISSLNCGEINDAVSNVIEIMQPDNCQSTVANSNLASPVPQVFIPNAFSPNGDGVNDRFSVFSDGQIVSVNRFAIYDRHGFCVYSRLNLPVNDSSEGWNGGVNGREVPAGVYLYAAEITSSDGSVTMYRGDVMLIR